MMLKLFVREYCHLCQAMLQDLQPLQAQYGFSLEVYDIDDNEEWEQQYAQLIPVLVADGQVLSYYHVNFAQIAAYFAQKA